MELKLKKVSAITAFSLLTCGSLISAEEYAEYNEAFDDSQKTELVFVDEQDDEIADSSVDDDTYDSMNTRNKRNIQQKRVAPRSAVPCPPLAGDPTRDAWDVFLTADVLIWKASEEGLQYTLKNNFPITNVGMTTNLPNAKSKIINAEQGWNGGFRVGLGYHLPKRKWDIAATYTWFQQNTHDKVNANDGQGLFMILLDSATSPGVPNTFEAQCRNAKANWKLHYNVLDVDLTNIGLISKRFSLRPRVGVRSAWIDQHLNVDYLNVPGSAGVGPFIPEFQVKQTNNFWGWGIRGGLDTVWNFWRCFSLYGNAAYSLLWGNFHVKFNQNSTFLDGSNINPETITQSYHALRANLEYALGFRWDAQFADERYHLALSLGWEEQLWFNQNQLNTFINAVNSAQFFKQHGDLGLSGITLNVRFDF